MDTNEKSKNGFSIRDSFFKSRRDDLHSLRTPPIALSERTTENRRIYARVLR
nr:hypothetical protein [uncultured Campylobacter sp.]